MKKQYTITYTVDCSEEYAPMNYLHIKSNIDGTNYTRAIRCSGVDYNPKEGFIFLVNNFMRELKESRNIDDVIRPNTI
jgi:hypothetical protein